MADQDGYNIIIVPEDHSRTRQIRLSRNMVRGGILLVALMLVTSGLLLATYGRVLVQARQADGLRKENRDLKAQVDGVADLQAEVARLEEFQGQVAAMLGVDLGAHVGMAALDSVPRLDGGATLDQWRAAQRLGPFTPRLWPVEGYISKEFFQQEEGSWRTHPGLDLVAPYDAPVRAAGSGNVLEARYDERFGNMIVLDHGFGLTTLYGHNSRLLVSEGADVEQGQVIANLGSTGVSSGPHLHFEVRVDGEPVDPRQYLAPQ